MLRVSICLQSSVALLNCFSLFVCFLEHLPVHMFGTDYTLTRLYLCHIPPSLWPVVHIVQQILYSTGKFGCAMLPLTKSGCMLRLRLMPLMWGAFIPPSLLSVVICSFTFKELKKKKKSVFWVVFFKKKLRWKTHLSSMWSTWNGDAPVLMFSCNQPGGKQAVVAISLWQ